MKLQELFSQKATLTEASSGYATPDDVLLLFVQKQLVGKELARVSMTDPSSAIVVQEVAKHSLADDNTYLIKYNKHNEWHPLNEHKEYKEAFVKKIAKWISKGTKVLFESPNWQQTGLLGLNIDVKAPYDDKFAGGLLSHVKEGLPVIIGPKANNPLKQAASIINHNYILKNRKDVLACQEELIDNGLKDFAEL